MKCWDFRHSAASSIVLNNKSASVSGTSFIFAKNYFQVKPELLIKYLVLNKNLSLPYIGTFAVEHRSARLNYSDEKISPPVQAITFTHENSMADKKFFDFLARQEGISELKAIELFNAFIQSAKNRLNTDHNYTIAGLGTLTEEYPGVYSFKPDYVVDTYLPTLRAGRIPPASPNKEAFAEPEAPKKRKSILWSDTEETTHSDTSEVPLHISEAPEDKQLVTLRPKWQKGALALFLLGILVLLVYFIFNGRLTV